MTLDIDKIAGLNVALNEATLIALDFDPVPRRANVMLELLSLPPTDAAPKTTVALSLFPIGRLVISLSESGTAKQVEIQTISALVESFRGQAIYGWEFIDPPNLNIAGLQNPLSLDYQGGDAGSSHVIHLFQDTKERRTIRWTPSGGSTASTFRNFTCRRWVIGGVLLNTKHIPCLQSLTTSTQNH